MTKFDDAVFVPIHDDGDTNEGAVGVDEFMLESFEQPAFDSITPQELGRLGEVIAACYLEHRGYDILERGYRCQEGEADLIAHDPAGNTIVLVEVKTRRVARFNDLYPEEAVDRVKRARYRRIASQFLMDRFPVLSLRFDVISVQIKAGQEARIDHFFDVFTWEAES